MARLMKKTKKLTSAVAKPAAGGASKVAARTDVRNSPVPKPSAPAKLAAATAPKAITHDQIARRAYEIWASGHGGSEFDNWVRAERELRGR